MQIIIRSKGQLECFSCMLICTLIPVLKYIFYTNLLSRCNATLLEQGLILSWCHLASSSILCSQKDFINMDCLNPCHHCPRQHLQVALQHWTHRRPPRHPPLHLSMMFCALGVRVHMMGMHHNQRNRIGKLSFSATSFKVIFILIMLKMRRSVVVLVTFIKLSPFRHTVFVFIVVVDYPFVFG